MKEFPVISPRENSWKLFHLCDVIPCNIITCSRSSNFLKILLLEEVDFLAKGSHFYLPFSETPTSDNFFPSDRKVLFNYIPHSNQWKRIFRLIQTISFVQSFFLLVETVTEISESQFLNKDHILTNSNLFFG